MLVHMRFCSGQEQLSRVLHEIRGTEFKQH